MIFGLEAWIFWLVLLIVFLVIEALTINMITIWFAIGCLAAIILDFLQASTGVQTAVMLGLSAVLLTLYILLLKPKFGQNNKNIVPTNADRFLGTGALVIETIDPIGGTGLIKALGQVWSAVSEDGRPIERGTMTSIVEIRGVKAVVRPNPADQTDQEDRI